MGQLCGLPWCPESCINRAPRDFHVPLIGKIYLGTVAAETALMVALAIAVITQQGSYEDAQVYSRLSLLCTAGFAFFSFDSVMSENRFQFWAANVAAVMFTFFIVFECFHNPTALGPVWHAMRFPAMAVKCVFQVAYLSFFFHVNESFGFFAYKVVGADARLVRLFEWYRAFLSLLKIDLFCFLLLLLMAKLFVLDTEVVDFGLGIAGLAFSFVFSFVGWWAITHEMRWLTLLFLAASALQPAYVAYKLYILDVTPTLLPSNVTYTQFAVVGGVTLAIRILLLVITFQNMRTFGEGLKQRVLDKGSINAPTKTRGSASAFFGTEKTRTLLSAAGDSDAGGV